MKSKLCYELLDIIEAQEGMICRQKDLIAKLVNENLEKENMINMLIQQEEYLYYCRNRLIMRNNESA